MWKSHFYGGKAMKVKMEIKMQKYINAEQYLGIVWASVALVMSHYT